MTVINQQTQTDFEARVRACGLIPLAEIMTLYKLDSSIDGTSLDVESAKIPQYHYRYLCLFSEYTRLLREEKRKYSKLELDKIEYFTGKLSSEKMKQYGWIPFGLKVLRSDVQDYLQADPDIQNMQQWLDFVSSTVDALEKIIQELNNRQWNIRNMIEWKKWTHGSI